MTKRRKDGEKAVSIYEFDEAQAFKECSVLHFNSANGPWLDFVSEKRSGIIQENLTTSFSPPLQMMMFIRHSRSIRRAALQRDRL